MWPITFFLVGITMGLMFGSIMTGSVAWLGAVLTSGAAAVLVLAKWR